MNNERSEAYLRAHTVGDLKPLSGLITIVDYDPNWPQLFDREALRIRTALGTRALRIEHTGSTAVPGLPAKPIIDITLEVQNSAAEGDYLPALEHVGYNLRIREPEWHEHRMLKGANPAVNLHVFSAACPETDRMLLFRDHLRLNPADRNLYASTKRQLAQQPWKYTQNYADAKSQIIEEIVSRAKR